MPTSTTRKTLIKNGLQQIALNSSSDFADNMAKYLFYFELHGIDISDISLDRLDNIISTNFKRIMREIDAL